MYYPSKCVPSVSSVHTRIKEMKIHQWIAFLADFCLSETCTKFVYIVFVNNVLSKKLQVNTQLKLYCLGRVKYFVYFVLGSSLYLIYYLFYLVMSASLLPPSVTSPPLLLPYTSLYSYYYLPYHSLTHLTPP